MSYAWAKIWIEALDDRKVASLPDSSWRRFFECVMLAKELDEGGFLPAEADMAWRLRQEPSALRDDLSRLALAGLVELRPYDEDGDRWYMPKFQKRQGPLSSTDRTRMQRERERKEAYYDANGDDIGTIRPTDKTRQDKTQKQTRRRSRQDAEADVAAAAAVLDIFKEYGIGINDTTRALAELDYVTPEYVEAVCAHVRDSGKGLGLAVHMIRGGEEPPPVKVRGAIPDDLKDVIQH